jgi:hypothetical protein
MGSNSGGVSNVATLMIVMRNVTISYDQSVVIDVRRGDIIPTYQLTVSPSTANLEFTASPSLPEGIILDPKTGRISGKADAAAEKQVYTIIGKNYVTIGNKQVVGAMASVEVSCLHVSECSS